MSLWNSILFQDGSSFLMNQFIMFHDNALTVLTLVTSLVTYWFISLFLNKMTNRFFTQHQTVEIVWTIIPMFLVMAIVLPSLQLLYLLDSNQEPMVTLKVTGNQWYWSYSFSDFPSLEFESYMTPPLTESGSPRLLDVDNRLPLPISTPLRLLITATDVIHAWTIPSLGVKVDAVPGRLNLITSSISRSGLFFGQCSEICGANHSFMPVTVESVPPKFFMSLI